MFTETVNFRVTLLTVLSRYAKVTPSTPLPELSQARQGREGERAMFIDQNGIGTANAHVHPTFSQILNRFAENQRIGANVQPMFAETLRTLLLSGGPVRFEPQHLPPVSEAEYRELLAAHDWFHEFSDDHRVYCEGHAELKELKRMQPELDPDFAIWNSYAPAEYQREGVAA